MRAPRERGLAFAAACAALCIASSAHAMERLALDWQAPPSCPSHEDVVAAVEHLLGEAAPETGEPVRATVQVSEAATGRWHVRLETPGEGAPRVRQLTGGSCAAVVETTALILAMMIDPTLPEPSPAPAPVPPPPAEAQAAAPVTTPSLPRVLALAALGNLDVGVLPLVSPGGGARLMFSIGRHGLSLGFAAFATQTARLESRPSAGGRLDLLLGELDLVERWSVGDFQLGPTLGLELGRMHGVGFGVTSPTEQSALWLAARLGLDVSFAFARHFAATLRVQAVRPLVAPTFVLTGVGVVHQPWDLALRCGVGLEYRFDLSI